MIQGRIRAVAGLSCGFRKGTGKPSPSSPGRGTIESSSFSDGPVDGAAFTTRVDQRHGSPAPGDAVIADNLPVHEVRSARKLFEDAGPELLFLPP